MREKQIAGIFLEIFLIVLILALLLAVVIPQVGELLEKDEAEPPEEAFQKAPAARQFLGRHPDFGLRPWPEVWSDTIGSPPPVCAEGGRDTLLLTPASHGTDGFFIAVLERRGA